MSAARQLHLALCQHLRAREAYRLTDAYRDEILTKQRTEPLVVSRFDVAMEPAPEEEQVLTVGAIADDGRPVALQLDEETRRKVARWLASSDGQLLAEAYPGELAMYRQLVRTLRTVVRSDNPDMGEVRRLLHHHASDDAAARAEGKSSRKADAAPDPTGRKARIARLLDEIRTHGGRWDTARVMDLYRITDPDAAQRVIARRDLSYLRWTGHVVQHGPVNGRYYTLKTRTGGHRA
ncbi:hypothetical protein [Streptomyces sp. BBFR109]|uniref:hypothetical protein n=1 Tax=Streptomyces sp. BBFR109 TaxID=3448172 RepID=UPI003F7651E2